MQERERLNSWKEIAAYLSVTVRTAQRWEKSEGLPVRRHKHSALSSVFAYRTDIDAWWHSRPDLRVPEQTAADEPPSIAVLPFVNLSRDDRDEILGDGLTEELIGALTHIHGLRVIARTSAFHFKGKSEDVRTIAARLGVKTVLEGSVRRSGERLRIAAQLINAADGCHLWAERYDRAAEDFLDLQDEIARAIADALRVELIPLRTTRDPKTYELYLEGRYYLNKRTAHDLQRAAHSFRQALDRDPRMARAWAALAECDSMLPGLGAAAPAQNLASAKASALKALEIDPHCAEAHTALGFMAAVYEYDWPSAEAHFLRALQLNPEHAESHVLYGGLVLVPTGRLEESRAHFERACDLDPCSAVTLTAIGMHFLMSREFDRALSAFAKALDLDANYPWAQRAVGEASLLLNRFDDAVTAFRKIENPAFAAGFLGYCYARTGRRDEAVALRKELEKTPSLAYQVAVLELGLGDRDAALTRLAEASALPSLGIQWLKTDPIWDALRDDPRFEAVLQGIGLQGPTEQRL